MAARIAGRNFQPPRAKRASAWLAVAVGEGGSSGVNAARLCAAIIIASGALLSAQVQRLPSEPPRQFGSSVTGAFEGWFQAPDGSRYFLVGYLNRNLSLPLDIPIGPGNRIEPGGPDMGQPTHFLPGRQTGVFLVPVPKDFTTADQRLTWTITANGQTTVIPLRLHRDYNVSPFTDVAVGNTPPVLRFDEKGHGIQGPLALLAKAAPRTASVGSPLALTVVSSDDAKYSSGSNEPLRKPPPPVELTWSKYRGPGAVAFEQAKPKLDVLAGGTVNVPVSGKGATTATFSQPGGDVLHVLPNDYSGGGGGGEACCWTTALVKVTVTP